MSGGAARKSAFPASGPPPGFRYFPAFLTEAAQARLVAAMAPLRFEKVEMHGVVARREVLHFGRGYEYGSRHLTEAPPPPDFLLDLRETVALAVGTPAGRFTEVLVTRYAPGAPIGWHRDAPAFELVLGVSLGSWCRFRFRKALPDGYLLYETRLAPGSLYAISGEARWAWQHHIPPVKELRYSITFRTERALRGALAPSRPRR